MRATTLRAALLFAAVAVILWVVPQSIVHAANNSEQVVFSTSGGSGTFGGKSTGFGFWIWCEGQSSNPYQGECNG